MLITDGVSFLAEFPITGKPLLFWPHGAPSTLSDFGNLSLKFVIKVSSSDELIEDFELAIKINVKRIASHKYELENLVRTARNLTKNPK